MNHAVLFLIILTLFLFGKEILSKRELVFLVVLALVLFFDPKGTDVNQTMPLNEEYR